MTWMSSRRQLKGKKTIQRAGPRRPRKKFAQTGTSSGVANWDELRADLLENLMCPIISSKRAVYEVRMLVRSSCDSVSVEHHIDIEQTVRGAAWCHMSVPRRRRAHNMSPSSVPTTNWWTTCL